MDRHTLITHISAKLKLLRVESGYTQDDMAFVLGVSKKTLVQIEKGRANANWTTVVAIAVLFRDSEILRHYLGEDIVEVIETIAHEKVLGKIHIPINKDIWINVDVKDNFILQQHKLSNHFRIVNQQNIRILSTIHKDIAMDAFDSLA
ncbi:DNA-binding XRE family transcriptional regulator [Salirhabdus euzebyi]|uniref:DNA-binding XRE family transcriptional regulator n=1 Tax=Salirhabdus euzebyi TaxID=394506 RepID=A0A841QA52_9BACI|nr:helix-turn-helix domain-containing protein [Salirhabdus euzebyi]MBB6455276.1 DNA-binding XRE family transcriptional regulator [Salirhabdus euzebyi]